MMLQLNPPLPLLHASGRKVTAYLVLDYGQEHDTLFLCGYDDTRELWWIANNSLRLRNNESMGRP
jgi:hypothetical protein